MTGNNQLKHQEQTEVHLVNIYLSKSSQLARSQGGS